MPIRILQWHLLHGYPQNSKLYIMKDYRRLKTDENSRLSLGWNLKREISKLNYRIHTSAIKENLIPPELTRQQMCALESLQISELTQLQ